jgi:hypothetical protein
MAGASGHPSRDRGRPHHRARSQSAHGEVGGHLTTASPTWDMGLGCASLRPPRPSARLEEEQEQLSKSAGRAQVCPVGVTLCRLRAIGTPEATLIVVGAQGTTRLHWAIEVRGRRLTRS